MRPDTIHSLNELNRRFYAARASSFAETRTRPWPGFAQVLETCRKRGMRRLAVLDLGCGHGRFGQLVVDRWPDPVRYTGVDQSAQLLALARSRFGSRSDVALRRCDLVEGPWVELDRYDLVVAFGLMHHVPGFATRRRVLRHAVRLLAPGGMLAMTFWQFAGRERFRRRMVPWNDLVRRAECRVDPTDLEPGDHLLAWGSTGEAVRYCHHASHAEMDRLVEGATAREVDRFRTDGAGGDLNSYRVVEPA